MVLNIGLFRKEEYVHLKGAFFEDEKHFLSSNVLIRQRNLKAAKLKFDLSWKCA